MPDRIILIGGTGFLGSSLVEDLVKSGYKCVVFTRSPENYTQNEKINYLMWINDNDYLAQYINDSYGVINLAGTSIAGKRWTKSYKNKIINSRVEITSTIVNAINICVNKPKIFISSSASGYYGDRGDEKLTEQSSAGHSFLSNVCVKWEESTKKLSTDVKLIIIRTGVVLHPDNGAFQKLLRPIKYFVGGILGDGKQYFPWIHIADWKRFLIFALQNNGKDKIYNLSAPNAETNDVLTKTIGKVYKRPTILKVPKFILRIVLGELSSLILHSQRMIPQNIQKTNFIYKYELLEEAIKDLKNFQKK